MAGLIDARDVARRVGEVRRRLAQLTDREVVLVAVTKGFGPEAPRAALAAGVVDLGENYAQELEAKAAVVPGEGEPVPTWHFIGRLQRNKVRHLAPIVSLWQSVDRAEVGVEIAKRAPGAAVLVQVDVGGEQTQGGVDPVDAPALAERLRSEGLEVRGVMAIGARGDDARVRDGFRRARDAADAVGGPIRSWGMTGDLELAVAEGSTMVRLGRALFGPRPV
ncbi:MAG: YggS family pyridoxal phosphate enzyme [Acidimicrobiales bacterium]|nr:YggS family pyridoxal phosphate enzyme [Acidimicrobiales bacterium]